MTRGREGQAPPLRRGGTIVGWDVVSGCVAVSTRCRYDGGAGGGGRKPPLCGAGARSWHGTPCRGVLRSRRGVVMTRGREGQAPPLRRGGHDRGDGTSGRGVWRFGGGGAMRG